MSSRGLLKTLSLASLGWLVGCSPKDSPAPTEARPSFRCEVLVSGKSMLPTFTEFETVQAEFCSFDALQPGDTVIRWTPEAHSFSHHRLQAFSASDHGFFTKGDGNSQRDSSPMRRNDFVCRTHKLSYIKEKITLPTQP